MKSKILFQGLFLCLLLPSAFLPLSATQSLRDSLRGIVSSSPSDSLRAEALNSLANSYMREDGSQMLAYARQALQLSEALENPRLVGRSAQKVGVAHFMMGMTDSALMALERAEMAFQEANYTRGRLEALTNLANVLFSTGDFVAAEQRVLDLYSVLDEVDSTGNFSVYRISPLIIIGNIQTSTGRYEEAVDNFRLAFHLASTLPHQEPKIPLIVNNLSSVFSQHLGQPDSALHYLEEALSSPGLTNNIQAKISISMNIGDLYEGKYEDWREARQWYRSAYELVEESGIVLQKTNILLRLAKVEMEHGERKKAEEMIYQAKKIAEQRREGNAVLKAVRMQVRLDSLTGDLSAALAHLHEQYALQDSLLGIEKQMEVQELQQEIELNRKDFEIQTLEQAREYDRRRSRLLLIIGLILGFLAVGWGIYQYLLIRKSRSLARAEAALRASSEALLQASLENQEKEKALLHQELDFKSQRLVDFATHLSVKKQLVQEITQEIRDHAVGPARDSLQKLLRRIQPQLQLDADQKELELYMERSHQNFILALSQQIEGLTKGEKKLAAMVRTGFSAKEIATLLNINPKSVEMNRYRLRKKLGLSPEQDLKVFLDEIAL